MSIYLLIVFLKNVILLRVCNLFKEIMGDTSQTSLLFQMKPTPNSPQGQNVADQGLIVPHKSTCFY